jgi:hypothetical protein
VTGISGCDEDDMETLYDWVTVAFFAGLVVLFLQRSMAAREGRDALGHYLIASIGCAGANWLGNAGYGLLAIAALLVTIAYVVYFLRPFSEWTR